MIPKYVSISLEEEINNFKPVESWSLDGTFQKDRSIFEASFYGRNKKKLVLNKDLKNTDRTLPTLKKAKTSRCYLDSWYIVKNHFNDSINISLSR